MLAALIPPIIAYWFVEKSGNKHILVKHTLTYLFLFGIDALNVLLSIEVLFFIEYVILFI